LIGDAIAKIETGTPPYGRRVVESRESARPLAPSPGWDLPPGTPRLSELTDEDRDAAKRAGAALKEKLRGRSQRL
jgi:hypothetical protein